MKHLRILLAIAFGICLTMDVLALSGATADAETPLSRRHLSSGNDIVHFGGIAGQATATRDTVLLMGPWGSGAPFNGQFQDPGGSPAWNGWTSADLTRPTTSAWHVDTYNAEGLNGHGSGNHAAWCGSMEYPYQATCDAGDPPGGYGNDFHEILDWRGTVADPASPCTVTVEAWLNHDTEPGGDFTSLQFFLDDGSAVQAWIADGAGVNIHVLESFTYGPGDYVDGDQVHVQWRVTSDGNRSDEDCWYYGAGACQIDDITVAMNNGAISTFDDFEDGTLGTWELGFRPGVGDYAALRSGLADLDPCRINTSPQVAFIDDGEVVPGTGGSRCITWCYGPGGYIVNPTTGLSTVDDEMIDNSVMSPVMPYPDGKEGCLFSFDVYRHEELKDGSPFIFYTWDVRSTDSTDAEDIEGAGWRNRDFAYYGGPEYDRIRQDVSDLLDPDTWYVQVRLSVYTSYYIDVWNVSRGEDGTPAPYFDNVRVEAFDFEGPAVVGYEHWLAQDRFPACGDLDLVDLGANSVRFDPPFVGEDRVKIKAVALGLGAELSGPPSMHYRLAPNPVFDPYRTAGLPALGQVAGEPDPAYADWFRFDLPDTGFLFPGDVLHCYFEATDDVGGGPRTASLPADTTGFSDFAWPPVYPHSFTFRALPSVNLVEDDLVAPEILLWDNASDPGIRNEWAFAVANLGLRYGRDFDLFTSTVSGDANGLGGVATLELLSRYDVLVYSGGEIGTQGLGFAGSAWESGPDLELLDAWLRTGGRRLLLTGDRVAQNLEPAYTGSSFLAEWAGAEYLDSDLRARIDGQYSPTVAALPAAPVFTSDTEWLVYGACPGAAVLDAVTTAGTGIALAEYTDPNGSGSTYPYAAAILNEIPAFDAKVILLPYDLSRIGTAPGVQTFKAAAPLATRALVLGDILGCFGQPAGSLPTPVPDAAHGFAVGHFPNPFNPQVTIAFELPRREAVSLRVFDVAGRLVRVLLDEEVYGVGRHEAIWRGTDDAGRPVSSGTYFYQLEAGDYVETKRMALIR